MEFILKEVESVDIYRLHNKEWQYVTTLTDVKVPNWEGEDNGRTMQEDRGMESK